MMGPQGSACISSAPQKNWQLPGRAFHHGRSDSTMDLLKGSLLCFKREQCQLPGMKNLLAKS